MIKEGKKKGIILFCLIFCFGILSISLISALINFEWGPGRTLSNGPAYSFNFDENGNPDGLKLFNSVVTKNIGGATTILFVPYNKKEQPFTIATFHNIEGQSTTSQNYCLPSGNSWRNIYSTISNPSLFIRNGRRVVAFTQYNVWDLPTCSQIIPSPNSEDYLFRVKDIDTNINYDAGKKYTFPDDPCVNYFDQNSYSFTSIAQRVEVDKQQRIHFVYKKSSGVRGDIKDNLDKCFEKLVVYNNNKNLANWNSLLKENFEQRFKDANGIEYCFSNSQVITDCETFKDEGNDGGDDMVAMPMILVDNDDKIWIFYLRQVRDCDINIGGGNCLIEPNKIQKYQIKFRKYEIKQTSSGKEYLSDITPSQNLVLELSKDVVIDSISFTLDSVTGFPTGVYYEPVENAVYVGFFDSEQGYPDGIKKVLVHSKDNSGDNYFLKPGQRRPDIYFGNVYNEIASGQKRQVAYSVNPGIISYSRETTSGDFSEKNNVDASTDSNYPIFIDYDKNGNPRVVINNKIYTSASPVGICSLDSQCGIDGYIDTGFCGFGGIGIKGLTPTSAYYNNILRRSEFWSNNNAYKSTNGILFSTISNKNGLPPSYSPSVGIYWNLEVNGEDVETISLWDVSGSSYSRIDGTYVPTPAAYKNGLPAGFIPVAGHYMDYVDDNTGQGFKALDLVDAGGNYWRMVNGSNIFINRTLLMKNAGLPVKTSPLTLYSPLLTYGAKVDNDHKYIHQWFNIGGTRKLYEWREGGNYQEKTPIFNVPPTSNFPTKGYYDYNLKSVILWFGNEAYNSSDWTNFYKLPRDLVYQNYIEYSCSSESCDSNTFIKLKQNCESTSMICSLGTCIPSTTTTCEDDDINATYPDGKNDKQKGTTTTQTDSQTDSCSGNILTEYFCSSNLRLSENVDCVSKYGSGYQCVDGKCALVLCGNGICDSGETPLNCPSDCAENGCGNNQCDYGENVDCPEECPDIECRDGICDPLENCAEDCNPEIQIKRSCSDIGDDQATCLYYSDPANLTDLMKQSIQEMSGISNNFCFNPLYTFIPDLENGGIEGDPKTCGSYIACSCYWDSSERICKEKTYAKVTNQEVCSETESNFIHNECVYTLISNANAEVCNNPSPGYYTISWTAKYIEGGTSQVNICEDGFQDIPCPSTTGLPFFNFINIIISIISIMVLYLFFELKKIYR